MSDNTPITPIISTEDEALPVVYSDSELRAAKLAADTADAARLINQMARDHFGKAPFVRKERVTAIAEIFARENSSLDQTTMRSFLDRMSAKHPVCFSYGGNAPSPHLVGKLGETPSERLERANAEFYKTIYRAPLPSVPPGPIEKLSASLRLSVANAREAQRRNEKK